MNNSKSILNPLRLFAATLSMTCAAGTTQALAAVETPPATQAAAVAPTVSAMVPATVAATVAATLEASATPGGSTPVVPTPRSRATSGGADLSKLASPQPGGDDDDGPAPRGRGGSDQSNQSIDLEPEVIPPTKPLAHEYDVLLRRSLFLKGLPPAPVSYVPRDTSTPADEAAGEVRRQQAALVFEGVTSVAGQPTAFVEDQTTQRIYLLKVGDSIASGKITGITLDTLDYTAGGGTITITIGNNFRGDAAVVSTASPTPVNSAPAGPDASSGGGSSGGGASGGATPAIATSGGGAAGGPPAGGGPAIGGAASSDPNVGDILERLRRRRLAELGGAK